MEPVLALLVGLFFATAVYLLLSKKIVRVLIGLVILGNAVNLTLFTAGRIVREVPPVIALDAAVPPPGIANALPQALILTAIVIGFGLAAFALMLVVKAKRILGTVRPEEMRDAEGAPDEVTMLLPAPDERRRDAA